MGTQYQLLTLFADGGWMMYPLVLCSLIASGVIIAKAWTLWQAHHGTARVIEEVGEAAAAGRIDEAIDIASKTPGPAAAILIVGAFVVTDCQQIVVQFLYHLLNQ